MPLIPLQIPPGCFKNGTVYQSRGRWFDADLVRWSEGAMQPIDGWERIQDGNGDIDFEDTITTLFAWRDNLGSAYLLAGGTRGVHVVTGGVSADITDGSFTAGQRSTTLDEGIYGDGVYGAGLYGEGSELQSSLSESQTWQMDNFGQIPLMVAHSDGRLLEWDLNTGNVVTVVTNAPTGILGVVVTPERFVVALGYDGSAADPRAVAWSDQENRNLWTPATTNQAGAFTLATEGDLMCGRRARGETILLTNKDAHAMRYIGGQAIYTFRRIGSNCGIIARQAIAQAEGLTMWMGRRSFFAYDGSAVRPVMCDISDEVFNNLNSTQRSKCSAVALPNFHEMWFMYPSAGSEEPDQVAVYNYMEQHWSGPWNLSRTHGIDESIFGSPYMAGVEGSVFRHEFGEAYDEPDAAATATISLTANPADGDTVTIHGKAYTFQTTLTNADGNVHIGASAAGTASNLVAAINLTNEGESSTGAGTDYAADMTQNVDVVATRADAVVTVTAVRVGTNGNALTLAKSGANITISGATFTGGTDTALLPSAESGPIEIGQGDQTLTIRRVIPDEQSLGDVDLTLFAALYPTATESSQVITTLDEPTDARLTGRQVRLKITQDQPGWRWGVARLEVVARGRR